MIASGEALAVEPVAGAEILPPNVPQWMIAPGSDVGSEPYGQPSKFEKAVVRNMRNDAKQYTSFWSGSALEDLAGTVAPNGLFYERHHGGIPEIDPAQHRLMVHGLMETPMVFTMEDIRRFPAQSRTHFIECAVSRGDQDGRARQSRRESLAGLVT